MASTSDKIRMTIVLDNALYFSFHEKVEGIGATHNGIIRKLIRSWLSSSDTGATEQRIRRQKSNT